MYTLVKAHRGKEDEQFPSLRAAKRRVRELWGRQYYAPSYTDERGRECWEVYGKPARYFPDGDPYAPFIRREE